MTKYFLAAIATAFALGISSPALQADHHMTLAEILLADGDDFDNDQNDYDIVTQFVLETQLDTAADEETLTAFLPTDKAFRILVEDVYGLSIRDEEALYEAILTTLTLPVVKDVLLYHLVGVALNSGDVVAAGDGYVVTTLLGETFTLDFKGKNIAQIRLTDNEPQLRDPIVRVVDITASNGVAHGIDRVLLPVSLLD